MKSFFRDWLSIIENPGRFFEQIQPKRTAVLKAVRFMVWLVVFSSLFKILFLISLNNMFITRTGGPLPEIGFGSFIEGLLRALLMTLGSAVISTGVLSGIGRLLQVKLDLRQLFCITGYAKTPYLFSAIPMGLIAILLPLWNLVLIYYGVKTISTAPLTRINLLFGIYIALVIIVLVLIFVLPGLLLQNISP